MLVLFSALSALAATGDGLDPDDIPFVKLRSDVWEIVIQRTSPTSAKVERVWAKCGDAWVNGCYAKHDSAFRKAVLTNVFRPEVRLEGDFQYCSSVVVDLPADMARRLIRPNTQDLCSVIGGPAPVVAGAPPVGSSGVPAGPPPEIRGLGTPGTASAPGMYIPPTGLPDVPGGAQAPMGEPLQARVYRAGDRATLPVPVPAVPPPTPGPVGSPGDPSQPLIAFDDDPRNVYQPRADAPPPEPLDPELAALLGDVPTVGSQGALVQPTPGSQSARAPMASAAMRVPEGESKGSFGSAPGAYGSVGSPGTPLPPGSAPVPRPMDPDDRPDDLSQPLIAFDDDPRNVYQPRADAPPPEPLDPELAALLGDVPTVGSQGALVQPTPGSPGPRGAGAPIGAPVPGGSAPTVPGDPTGTASAAMRVPEGESKGSLGSAPGAYGSVGSPGTPLPPGSAPVPRPMDPDDRPDDLSQPLIAFDDDPRNVYQPRPDAPPPEPLDPELAALLGDVPTVGSQGALVQPTPGSPGPRGAGAPIGAPVPGGSAPTVPGDPTGTASAAMRVPEGESKGSFGSTAPSGSDEAPVPGAVSSPSLASGTSEPAPVDRPAPVAIPAPVDRPAPAVRPTPRGPDEFELEARDASQLERLSDRRRASQEAQSTKKKRRKKNDEPIIEEVGGGRRYLVIELESLPEDEEGARKERAKKAK